MRSKEVGDNINLLITYRGNLWQQHKAPKITKAIDKTIDYIEDLEEENKDVKEYADDVWRKQEELRAENEKLQDELIEEKQFNVKCLKLRDEEYIKKSVIRDKIKEKQERIDKMHPASDCVLIDDLENQIQVLKEILGE